MRITSRSVLVAMPIGPGRIGEEAPVQLAAAKECRPHALVGPRIGRSGVDLPRRVRPAAEVRQFGRIAGPALDLLGIERAAERVLEQPVLHAVEQIALGQHGLVKDLQLRLRQHRHAVRDAWPATATVCPKIWRVRCAAWPPTTTPL